jgi:hypothetical protein
MVHIRQIIYAIKLTSVSGSRLKITVLNTPDVLKSPGTNNIALADNTTIKSYSPLLTAYCSSHQATRPTGY